MSNERSKERTDLANKSAKRSSHKVDALFSCSRTCCGTSLSCSILRNGSIGQRHPFSVLFCSILLKNVRRAFSKKAVTVWGLSKKKKREAITPNKTKLFPFSFFFSHHLFCSFVVVFQDEEPRVVLYESSQVKYHLNVLRCSEKRVRITFCLVLMFQGIPFSKSKTTQTTL